MPVVFKPNGNFDRYFNSPNGPVGRYARSKAMQTAQYARGFVGRDSGGLRRSIKVGKVQRTARGLSVRVHSGGPRAPYALAHHRGSRPHLIGSRGQALRIGRRVVAGPVRHPGTKPNPYMTRALRVAMRGR